LEVADDDERALTEEQITGLEASIANAAHRIKELIEPTPLAPNTPLLSGKERLAALANR
jgi:hypothetical protein